MAWSSRDLTTWTETVLPVPTGASEAAVSSLARVDDGYIAAGQGGGQTLTWLTADGVAWRLADATPRADRTIDHLADGPAGLLAFGALADKGRQDTYHLAVWRTEPP